MFLEQDSGNFLGNRIYRFKAAYGGSKPAVPIVMLESGYLWKNGLVKNGTVADYQAAYQAMVDAELARDPQAEVHANYLRVGTHLETQVLVKNLSGVPLSSDRNGATVNIIVYEDIKTGLSSRTERAVVGLPVNTPLGDGESALYPINTPNLTVNNWNNLHTVAFIDYMPGGTSGPYDMLQAAVAEPRPTLAVQPTGINFVVNWQHYKPSDISRTLTLNASLYGRTWTATEDIPWLTMTPTSGSGNASILVTADVGKLAYGDQSGQITFKVNDDVWNVQQVLIVKAFYGGTGYYYQPLILRK